MKKYDKFKPLRSKEDVSTDIVKLEKLSDGLINEILNL